MSKSNSKNNTLILAIMFATLVMVLVIQNSTGIIFQEIKKIKPQTNITTTEKNSAEITFILKLEKGKNFIIALPQYKELDC